MAQSSLSRLPMVAKLGIGAGLLLLIGLAYFVVFYGDLASAIKAAENKEKQLRDELSDARKVEFAYQKDLAELNERKQRASELQKILPVTAEGPSFLSSVAGVATATGIALSAYTPQPEVPEEFYARVPMKLELRGRFHQVAKFFYGVGQLDRIINMENISVTDPKLEGEETAVKVEVLATAFRMLPEGQGKKTDKRGAATPARKPGAPAPATTRAPGGKK